MWLTTFLLKLDAAYTHTAVKQLHLYKKEENSPPSPGYFRCYCQCHQWCLHCQHRRSHQRRQRRQRQQRRQHQCLQYYHHHQ